MISVRLATADDNMNVAKVHVRSWQVGYRGLISDEYLEQIRVEERAARYNFEGGGEGSPETVLAVDGHSVLGFVTYGASRDEDRPQHAEIFALYVDPDAWGRGIGTALIASARSALRARHFDTACLWVLSGNVRATRFYEGDGWGSDGASRDEMIWGVPVSELRYSRSLAQ